ncbi:hypothetical protein BKA61DRAFT_720338 [Leptodontidium sp. MPI-SDFR-AT-0119]|nr:hypothetical protein BKA61DRAFT_720338 [Leptodontidium sp. MPI-SDFR-AT-0119]
MGTPSAIDEVRIAKAIEEVRNKTAPSAIAAAQKWCVNYDVMRARMQGRQPNSSRGGQNKRLNEAQEVTLYLFKGRKSKPLALERKLAHEEDDIRGHFISFDEAVTKYRITPRNCWNFDETGWRIGVLNRRLVFTFTDISAVYMEDPNTRESLTSIEACNAAGDYAPSTIIMPGFELLEKYLDNDINDEVRYSGPEAYSKLDFLNAYNEVTIRTAKRETIQHAWRKAGLWPLDPERVIDNMQKFEPPVERYYDLVEKMLALLEKTPEPVEVDWLKVTTPETSIAKVQEYSEYINKRLASAIDDSIPLTPSVTRVIEKRDKAQNIMVYSGVLSSEELSRRKTEEARRKKHKIFWSTKESAAVFEFVNTAKDLRSHHARKLKLDGPIRFCIEYNESSLDFLGSGHGTSWEKIGTVNAIDITGSDFIGPIIGVFAAAEHGSPLVRFSEFLIDQVPL